MNEDIGVREGREPPPLPVNELNVRVLNTCEGRLAFILSATERSEIPSTFHLLMANKHGDDYFSSWSRDESIPTGSGVAIIGPRSMASTGRIIGNMPGYLLAYHFTRSGAGDLIVICLYLPHGRRRRDPVLQELSKVLQLVTEDDAVIIGGDFNAAFNPSADRPPPTEGAASTEPECEVFAMLQANHLVDLSLNWAHRQPGGDENLAPHTHKYDGNKWSRIDYCFVSENLCQLTRSIDTITSGYLTSIKLDHAMIHASFDAGPLWDAALRERIHAARSSTSRIVVCEDACTQQ